ncbi:MAG: superoxide dismutase [Alphaproteobacteria bacterium]|nr:superoxide dismutase [Alphaproteobacteria bacterium]
MFELPKLNYALNALEPHISEKTMSFHYGKHHATYIKNANTLVTGTAFEKKSLEEIVAGTREDAAQVALFNNAAQCVNHSFFWDSLTPNKREIPKALLDKITADFGSLDAFKEQFVKQATGIFGSGWCWLVVENGKLKIVSTSNAQTPIVSGTQTPLLCVDVWEHAYYLDYQNARAGFIQAVVDNLWNWEFAAQNMTRGK